MAAGRATRTVNPAAKAALVVLLLHAALNPDLVQYTNKGVGWRLLLYPLSIVLVPLVWATGHAGRRHARSYPHLIDLCVVAPFLLDTAGNAANLYDTVSWWDDVMHVATWLPLVIAFGLALQSRPRSRVDVAVMTVGFGAVTHVLWEVAEYVTFVQGNASEATGAYRDTIGDLVASLAGSTIGAVLVTTVLWGRGQRATAYPPSATSSWPVT